MMKFLNYFSRVFVGSLFIVSGLIKANDPLGFSYKLGEYFAESALNLPFLEPYALLLGVLACLAEIVLGFAVIFGGKMPLATWSLLGLTLFFGWLTFYTATCDPQGTYTIIENGEKITRTVTCVTDCGCFGDALKGSLGRSLTPWESFSKDMVLLVFIIPLFWNRNKIKVNDFSHDVILFPFSFLSVLFFSWVFSWYFPVVFFSIGYGLFLIIRKTTETVKTEWFTAIAMSLISCIFIYYCYTYLPIRDYRPFAMGKSIPEQIHLPEGAEPDQYETILTYKNSISGEIKDFTATNYPWEDSTWVWQNTENKLIKKGYEPPIHDFNLIASDGSEYTEDLLNEEFVFLLIAYDINKSNKKVQAKINTFAEAANNAGIYFYGVSASLYEDVEKFRHENQSMFEYLSCDETTLKTIIRSNPGLILLKKGVVSGKWHYNNFPEFENVKEKILK